VHAAPAPPCLVLVSCADSGDIRSFSLDGEAGRLTPRQVLEGGGQLMPMALSPDRRRLYVARRSPPLAVLSLALHDDGQLEVLGEAALPVSMAYIACDRSGRWLLSASYGEHCLAVSPIGSDGVADAAQQVLPAGRHAHSIVVDPTGRFAHAACLGDDTVLRLAFDAERGLLAPTEPPGQVMRAGSGPRHLVYAAGGSRLYVLNELDATIDRFDRDTDTGDLTQRQTVALMPSKVEGKPWAAELRLSPQGHWLLATERRSSTMSLWAVDPASGQLTLCDRVKVETQPRGMQWSPDGRYALVAGQQSSHLASWRVDHEGGRLSLCDRVPTGGNPNWIETVVPRGWNAPTPTSA
jgi:6-phosphogluconolactonase